MVWQFPVVFFLWCVLWVLWRVLGFWFEFGLFGVVCNGLVTCLVWFKRLGLSLGGGLWFRDARFGVVISVLDFDVCFDVFSVGASWVWLYVFWFWCCFLVFCTVLFVGGFWLVK